jgi:hypothetical protein
MISMTLRIAVLLSAVLGLPGACMTGTAAEADPSPQPRLYEVTTETGMPHLETSLRYATVTHSRCLDLRDLSRAFWMLEDVSLQDCRLVKSGESADAATYLLQCHGGHGTTGRAAWQLGPGAIAGTLDVRLGGKNMTFFQRITARPIGGCG